MILKVDIDNVIRDMGSEMVRLYNSCFTDSKMTTEDITQYDVREAFPKLKERKIDARKFFFEDNSLFVYCLPEPMEGSIKGLQLAKELGYEIILVSYQPSVKSQADTLKWLSKHKVPYDTIVFTNKEDKTLIKADYIIDDNPKFLDADSAKTVCIDWAYNRHKEYDYRVKSIEEFILQIK